MKTADQVLVNSQFTARAAARLGVGQTEVIYPGVNAEAYANISDLRGDENIILVVSRFDPRKNQALAVNAFARLRALAPDVFAHTSLALAGGLDASRHEDRTTAAEVTALIRQQGLDDKVTLYASPSETERLELLRRCWCVLHPAPDEHFGIVPVEAMAAGRPVVAVANAGPLETILDGETGFLCPPTPDAFAQALAKLGRDATLRARLGRAGRLRATRFSHRAFGAALEGALTRLFDGVDPRR
jgi:alpha-1,3/alpha-1,6-mannosyltransferase